MKFIELMLYNSKDENDKIFSISLKILSEEELRLSWLYSFFNSSWSIIIYNKGINKLMNSVLYSIKINF